MRGEKISGDEKRKYSIEEIANICHVSKATVSRVINNSATGVGKETRARVQKVIDSLNYRPNNLAQSIATARSRMIGLIVPDVSNFFYPKIIRSVTDYMNGKGYAVLIGNSDYDPEKEADQLLNMIDKRVDGIILCSGVSNATFLEDFRKYKVPLALIGRSFDSSLSDVSITGDNEKGAYKSASYLIEGGNRRIVYVEGNPKISGSIQRLRGYRSALEEAGLPFDPKLVLSGEYSIEYGKRAADYLVDQKIDFDAVMTGSDLIAIGIVSGLLKRGIQIPEEIELVGFDNIELSGVFHPSLTTISKPHYDMAQHISRQLINIIEGKEPSLTHMQVEPSLVIRETTRERT